MSGVVQYVVVRGDLARTMGWPLGAVVAQACHACTAVIHLFYNDAHTQAYLADLDNMHKVVLEVSIDFRERSLPLGARKPRESLFARGLFDADVYAEKIN